MNGDLSTSCNLSNCDCDKPKPMTDQRARATIDSKEFYDLCQTYRHAPVSNQTATCAAFSELIIYIDKALADERRRGFHNALEKVTQDFADNLYEIGGDIGTNEVLAFLESRIVHYPEAKAHTGQEGHRHEWGTDGAHSNEFCKRCFQNKPQEASYD